MKRIPVLAVLLALAPWAWSEEIVQVGEGVPSTETMDAPSADAADSMTTAAPVPSETSTVSPIAAEAAAQSTVTPVAGEPVEPAAVDSVSGEPSRSAGEAAGEFHKVVQGDTLWDLAGSYLKDPFQWTRIYEANRDKIENPRLIFPNQEFVIPTVEAAAALAPAPAAEEPTEAPAVVQAPPAPEPAGAPEAEPAAASDAEPAVEPEAVSEAPAQAEDMDAEGKAPKKMIEPVEEFVVEAPDSVDEKTQDEREAKKKKSMAVPGAGFMGGQADSFLADENWEYDGYVLRDRDQRMMISQGDVVFLNIGAASGVKPKMFANVYRVGKKVKDPYLKKKAGRMIKRVGTVIVTGQITDEGCTAVVTNSLEPIRIGDIVKFTAR